MKLKIDFYKFLKEQKLPIGVVCNDAGASNLIAYWLKDICDDLRINCFVQGPAKTIFENICPKLGHQEFYPLIKHSNTLITGTSWSTSLEHDARKLMNSKLGKNIAVLDHWTNYMDRFKFDSELVLPEKILVSDAISYKLAREIFPDIEIREFKNNYLENICSKITKNKITIKEPSNNILYVLEPIRDDWGKLEKPGEFIALDYFAENISKLGFRNNIKVKLRVHPSENKEKYLNWISSNKSLDIGIDSNKSLEQSITWSDTVVGCQTYAMVVALAAGRKVITTIPPWMPKCKLPHKEIFTLEELKSNYLS
ncbi:MAG: hypothetical protein CBB97_15050 [Candidatus Endolissoclinum sp. TMED37]|nr:MAG: hypothetical protein CBB97_15050 [Candidatus Endolissoclinum sp. TMED37]